MGSLLGLKIMDGWYLMIFARRLSCLPQYLVSVSALRQCHSFLTPHRLNRDDSPFEVQQLEEPGDRRNFIGLLLDFELPPHQAVGAAPRTHQRDRRRGGGTI